VPTEIRMIQQAYKFALDPTSAQARMLASFAGAKRASFNFAHAMIMAGADACKALKDELVLQYLAEGLSESEAARKAKAEAEATIPVPRQMKIPDPADPRKIRVLHRGVGVEWTEFTRTAVGCTTCRRLLARNPGSSAPWADARTGSVTCDPDALKRLGIEGEPGPHDPAGVGCKRCRHPLHQIPDGTWADKNGSAACPEARDAGAPHEPRSDFMAWTKDVFSGTIQAAHRDADVAWQRFLHGKSRRPRFKKKGKCTESFQVHGDDLGIPETTEAERVRIPEAVAALRPHGRRPVQQQTAQHITLPKIGPARVMSDDSLHPAMRRSRRRGSGVTPAHRPGRKLKAARARLEAAGRAYEHAAETMPEVPASTLHEVSAARDAAAKAEQAVAYARQRDAGHGRHMGNRRRFRQLHRHMRKSGENAARLGPLLRQVREDAGWTLDQAVTLLGTEADARAVAAVRARLAAAEDAADIAAAAAAEAVAAGDAEGAAAAEKDQRNARNRVKGALKRLGDLAAAKPGEKASRTDRWSAAKLKKMEATGVTMGLDQASVICSAYRLGGQLREQVTDLAAQARIVRATITLGADGLWWCSVGAEIPYAVRTAPSKRQEARGTAGIDFGTARLMTITGRRPVTNPSYYEKELAALGAAQRHAGRTVPGSGRHRKAKARAGLIHADVARLRADTLHRATTSLSRNFSVLGFEGFNVQQLMRDGSQGMPRQARGRRNRSLADAGIGMAREMLRQKGPRCGATVVTLGPDVITITGPRPEDAREADLPPDAKPNGIDAGCGQARTKPARPHEALYRCDACGRVRLRTLNSAENIRRWADEALTADPGCAISGPDQSRGGDEPVTARAGRSPVKRAAITSSRPRRGEAGTPGG
jgi:transposase